MLERKLILEGGRIGTPFNEGGRGDFSRWFTLKLELADNVIEYLGRLGQSELTLDLEEMKSSCCVGRLPEIKFHGALPQNPEKYRHYSVQGIHIHVSRLLRTENTLTFTLSGIGLFKKIEVSGVNLIL